MPSFSLPGYDSWKTTDPSDRDPHLIRCPWCKARHYEHERCDEAEMPDDGDHWEDER